MDLSSAAVLQELAECRNALREVSMTPEMRWAFVIISIVIVLFAGLMAGLTLGLLSLDKVDLEVIKRSGSAKDIWLVEQVEPVLARPHFLLATLLLCNSVAMEALPLFLDRLLNPAAAIILSVSAILVCGEIVPQAVCKRYGLQVGAYMAWFVSFLMLLTAVITWPIGKLLDRILGEGSALFKRRELKALMSIHADPTEDSEEAPTLTLDEVQVIQGALDMASKTAESAMTPIDKVFVLSSEAEVNDELLLRILQRGHSRLPVYEGDNKQNIIGLVLVKELLLVDEDAGVCIRDLRLRELPFMSADTMLYDVLKVLRFGRSHMACLTQLGPTGRLEVVGVITIEDVLEELLQQEIVDETDEYVDNLQTVPTQTLRSLQELPPNLRQFLTRSIIMSAPPGADGLRHVHSVASMGAAAAAGAAAASSQGSSPRAVAAAAAAAATSVLLSLPQRRGMALLVTSLQGAERERADEGAAAPGALDACGGSAPTAASSSLLSALVAHDKPPIPRRISYRSPRDRPHERRHSSERLRQPLLESDQEGESPHTHAACTVAPAPVQSGLVPSTAEWAAFRQQQMCEMLQPRDEPEPEVATNCRGNGSRDAEQQQQALKLSLHSSFRPDGSEEQAAEQQQQPGDDGSDMV